VSILLAFVVAGAAAGCTPPPVRSYAPRLERDAATSGSAAATPSILPDAVASSTVPAALLRERRLRPDAAGLGFDVSRAIDHARAITAFGVRQGGSAQERMAADYVAGRLREMGLAVRLQEFRVPTGATSVNVIAVVPGRDKSRRLLLGAHTDSKPPSPGANDNASGCGLLLECARVLGAHEPPVTVEFVFWGTEEFLPRGTDAHHLGSRHHAASLSKEQRRRYVGVVSVDMVGVGSDFHVRTMERGPQSLRRMMLADGVRDGVRLTFLKDPGRTGWSDHEPYELRGIPAVWLQWQRDPHYHTVADTADKLDALPMRVTGEFLLGFVHELDQERVKRLDAGR
jgi:aminopeptidase YwaD